MMQAFFNKTSTALAENKLYQSTYFLSAFGFLLLVAIYCYPTHSGHDLNFHMIRFDALVDALRDGSFPVYIDYKSIDGYGYGTRLFYSDFMLIPFAYLAQHLDLIASYKIMLIFYTLLCGYLSYLCGYKVTKNSYISFVFCILYTFSFYRFFDAYNRGALGETIALTFVPLVFWGLYEIVKGNYKKWYIIAIGFSLMILSHAITTGIVAVTVAVLILVFYKSIVREPKRLAYLAFAAITSVLLSAYFLLPFVEQLLSDSFYFAAADKQYIISTAVQPFKDIVRGLFTGIEYSVQQEPALGIVITMCIFLRVALTKGENIKNADRILLFSVIILLLISPVYPWRIFPFNVLGFMQFSWRLYTIVCMTFAMAGAIYLYYALQTNGKRYAIGIPLVVILTALVLLNSGRLFTERRDVFTGYDRNELNYALSGAEYLPSKVPNSKEFFANRGSDSIRTVNAETQISNFDKSGRILSFNISEVGIEKRRESLELPLVYYKGYKAEIDSEDVEIKESESGLVELPISKTGQAKVYFGGTVIQNISPYITLFMAIFLAVYIVLFNRKNHKTNA